jgi:ABC-type branched-subunit amino acid transport system substrate-binding protein
MKVHKGAVTALLVGALAAGGLTACGGDDDDNGASGTTSAAPAATTPAASTTSGTATATAVDPSKPKVVLALNALKIPAVDLLTPYTAGAKAAAKAINAKGGFGGRELVIETCNTQYQPATTATCARKTLAKKPVAMIGCDPVWPNAGLPIYAKAKVPSFNCPNVPADFNNPLNFSMTGGTAGDMRATARWLCTRADVNKVVVFTQDIPIQHTTAPDSIGPTLKGCNKSVSYIYYPITGSDITPQVTQAAQRKPDAVITLGGGALAINIYKLFGQAGVPADKIIGSSNQMAYESVLKPAGKVMEGAYASFETKSWGDTSDPDVAAYLKAMEGAGFDAQDGNPQTGYMDVMTVYTAAQKIGFDKFDTASLANFMNTANDVPVPLTRSITNPGPKGAPQIKQTGVQIVQWKDGKLNVITEGTDDGWVEGY